MLSVMTGQPRLMTLQANRSGLAPSRVCNSRGRSPASSPPPAATTLPYAGGHGRSATRRPSRHDSRTLGELKNSRCSCRDDAIPGRFPVRLQCRVGVSNLIVVTSAQAHTPGVPVVFEPASDVGRTGGSRQRARAHTVTSRRHRPRTERGSSTFDERCSDSAMAMNGRQGDNCRGVPNFKA